MALVIKSSLTGQCILELEVSGVAELTPDEMTVLLEALRHLPVAQHFILRHGGLPPVRGDDTAGGSLDSAIGSSESASRIEAARLGITGAVSSARSDHNFYHLDKEKA